MCESECATLFLQFQLELFPYRSLVVPPFQRLSILNSIQYYGNHCTENIDMADIKLHRYNAKMSYDVN